jgi:enamine deaminase RidA (YjgF/YER057c/UK114 family)
LQDFDAGRNIPRNDAVGCATYARYFPKNPPAGVFVNVPAWPGHFDIKIDCVAAVL